MKCYRVYVNNEIMGTWFKLSQAVWHADLFLAEGYEGVKIEIEKYEY